MNRLIIGRPGGGKSYHGCKLILDALEQARVVVTNMPMHTDRLAKDAKRFPGRLIQLDNEAMQNGDFFFEYSGAFFVVDEAKDFLPAGIQQKDLTKGWAELLTKHRHYEDWKGRSSEVVLISQCASQLPKCVRTLVEQTVVCKKLRAVGASKFYSATAYEGPQGVDDARESSKLVSEKGKYSASVWNFYQSHSMAGDKAGHVEASGGHNVFTGSVGRFVGIMLLVGGGGVYMLSQNELTAGLFGGSAEGEPVASESRANKGQGAAVVAVRDEPTPPAVPARSSGEVEPVSWLPDEPITATWNAGDKCGVVTISGRRLKASGADCGELVGVQTVDGSAAVEAKRGGGGFDLGGVGLALR